MSVRRAQDERIEGTPDGNSAITEISDVPDAPTIGAVTDPGTDGYASVAFTPAVTGGTATSYTATSSPGSISGTGASSPVTVTGLTIGQSYTFTVTGTNSTGTGAASAASSTFTPTQHTSYESIATVTVGSGGSSSISFSSIPSTYKHLQVRCFSRANTGATNVKINFNSDTGSNYADHQIYGDGSNAGAGANSSQTAIQTSGRAISTANIGAVFIIDILDYTNTSKYKTLRGLQGWDENGSGTLRFTSGLWQSTNTITSIAFTPVSNNFGQYSHFALYGIKGA